MKVTVENGVLKYKKILKEIEVPATDIIWGYLQLEDVKASMCCGGFNSVIGRAVLQEKSGKKHVFQKEGEEYAREILHKMQEANPEMAVGYTEENRKKFSAF